MAPAATGAWSPAAAPVAKGYRKVAARSVWLGLPALPPVPGLRLAAQGQTRAASSFCNRLARNVVAMATGEPSAAPLADNEELTEFVNVFGMFNHLHSSIRNVVERSLGVRKMRWRILLKMPSYPIEKQKMIVAATMCLHNFIRENSVEDKHFSKCDRNPDYVPTIPSRYSKYVPTRSIGDTSIS